MKIRIQIGVIISLFLIMLISGCGSKTPAEEVYADMLEILDNVYEELGRPEVNWDTMVEVKDIGFERMLDKREEWPAGTVFSLSVMDDSITIHVKVGDSSKAGDWKP